MGKNGAKNIYSRATAIKNEHLRWHSKQHFYTDPGLLDMAITYDDTRFLTCIGRARTPQGKKNATLSKSNCKALMIVLLTFQALFTFSGSLRVKWSISISSSRFWQPFVSVWEDENLICGRPRHGRFTKTMHRHILLCLWRHYYVGTYIIFASLWLLLISQIQIGAEERKIRRLKAFKAKTTEILNRQKRIFSTA